MYMATSSWTMDQLVGYGVPYEYVQTLSKLFFAGDIIGLPVRLAVLALVTLVVPRLKSWYRKAMKDIDDHLFVTAHAKGSAANWILAYMYLDPNVQQQLLQFRLFAEDSMGPGSRKLDRILTAQAGQEVDAGRRAGATYLRDGVCFRRSPLNGRTVVIKHQGRKIWITRQNDGFAGEKNFTDHFRITTWRWSQDAITDILMQAHGVCHEKHADEIHIYNHVPRTSSGPVIWDGPVIRLSRPWSSVVLPGTVKEDLLDDVKTFISVEDKEWYVSKGIPHRRGYLLHGPPGTGKTTVVTALAGKLRMDLYIVNPSAPGMDDSQLQRCFRGCPQGSLLLIEDIDCVMPLDRGDRHKANDPLIEEATVDGSHKFGEGGKGKSRPKSSSKTDHGDSRVTLSGLLNAIDGVASQEDSVLFASTNYPDKLDEALRRPGRFDVHVSFDFAAHQQVADLYKHFYPVQRSSPLNKGTPSNEVTGLDQLANEFADNIMGTGVKVSVAAIQAYLLLYKKDAGLAMDRAEEWADGLRREQEATQHGPDLANGFQNAH